MPDLDWELGAFRAARALWRWLFPAPLPYDADRVALLAPLTPRLVALARIVSGLPVRVLPARDEGGVRGLDLLLPGALDVGPDPEVNRALYVVRAAHAAAIARIATGVTDPDPVRASLVAVVAARDLLRGELPGFGPAWEEACALVLAARPPGDSPLERARRAVLAHAEVPPGPLSGSEPPVPLWGRLWPAPADVVGLGDPVDGRPPDGTELPARPVDDVRRVVLDPKRQEDHVVFHPFEKVETAEAFDGNVKTADGADELADHLEALGEVDLRELVRDGSEAHSVYRADIDLQADVPDVEHVRPDEHGVPYDEWDFRARAYRRGWCTVYPTAIHGGSDRWAAETLAGSRRLVDALRKRLEDQRSRRAPLDRQLDGEDVDLDALVDHHADVRAGRTGSPRLYIRRERRRRDLATTVLLDVSLSSDAWVADRRVLDVSREAVLVLGEVAEALGDRLEVLAFASSTRNRCRVWTIRGMGEPWRAGRARLGAIEPQGYTRIGPALRHAAQRLAAVPADRRFLLLVSDGKPNDYDRYEGRYGVADVRMALREAREQRIVAHALTVDAGARAWLPEMFGPGGWHALPRPELLVPALGEVYGRWTA